MKRSKENTWLILPLFAISTYDDGFEITFGWLSWTFTILF
jgi:hypothetical protein